MSEWISVKDRLPPEEYENYLLAYKKVCNCCCQDSKDTYYAVGYAYYMDDVLIWRLDEPFYDEIMPNVDTYQHLWEITHWMSLPELMEKEDD